MNAPHEASEERTEAQQVTAWLGQTFGILVFALVATFSYAFYGESALFRAAGLQLALAALVIWSTRRAASLPDARRGEKSTVVEAWSLHYIFTASPLAALLFAVLVSLLASRVEISRPLAPQEVAASAIVAVLAASVWTALRHIAAGFSGNLIGYSSVLMSLHESRIIWFAVALGQLVSSFLPSIPLWLATLLHVYLAISIIELLLRLVVAWFQLENVEQRLDDWPDPLDSIAREAVFTSLNPLDTLFTIAERRFGLSLRSSWSIQFFRHATLPALFATAVLFWLSTAFVIVQPHQLALVETIGRVEADPLGPGLHVIRPWPLGIVRRVSVGEVHTMQIGFQQDVDQAAVLSKSPRSMLWTEPHQNEFALVLGTQSELVSINSLVYYQVGSSPEKLKQYLYRHARPEAELEAIAYQVLREETQSATLEQVLTFNREQFARRVRAEIKRKSEAAELGIEIVDVAMLSLHPPVQVADSYLDVSNAERDAERLVVAAKGDAGVHLENARRQSANLVAVARKEAAVRVGLAGEEAAQFLEVSKAYQTAPETYRLRAWFDAYEKTLPQKKVYVIDAQLPEVLLTDPHAHLNIQNLTPPPAK